MDSLELVEHFRIKKHQIWYVHKLGTFKSIQITTLIIIWVLELILEWIQLQQLCVTVSYPVASLSKIFENICKHSNPNMRIWVFTLQDLFFESFQYDSFFQKWIIWSYLSIPIMFNLIITQYHAIYSCEPVHNIQIPFE
jgi:hypothetical protein